MRSNSTTRACTMAPIPFRKTEMKIMATFLYMMRHSQ